MRTRGRRLTLILTLALAAAVFVAARSPTAIALTASKRHCLVSNDDPRVLFELDDEGTTWRMREAHDYGLDYPTFHFETRLFVEHLAGTRPDAFEGFLADVLDGEVFVEAFRDRFVENPRSARSSYIEGLRRGTGHGAEGEDPAF